MKAKQWAFENGFAKNAGKGRMSREAHEAIRKAIGEGMVFDDYRIDKSSGVVSKGPVVVKQKTEDKPSSEGDGFNAYAGAFYRFGEGTEFQYEHEGKVYAASERTACMGCGYSLIGHTCDRMVGLTKHGQKVITVKGG